MQITSSNNILSQQKNTLKSLYVVTPNSASLEDKGLNKPSRDAIAQGISEKVTTTNIDTVYLANTMHQKGSGFTETIASIINERTQKVDELVAQGIDRTTAKYAIAGEMAKKGAAAMAEFKEEQDDKVLKEGTKKTENENTEETTEEVVEEQVELPQTYPSSGERVEKVKTVKKVKKVRTKVAAASVKHEKVQSTKPASTARGSNIDVKV
ncbi:MAG: hypothetical protein MI749_08605 [Desulfovibrionales bacterium]|nr:hypothetical protein [Desulfovibrionales bacterium]